ncbi:MAG: hypothetical protein QOE55_4649 [Acidobacteriaceae bacterium]|nr:hypothetical protein [Acidobacteriaceae bacterium]
MGAKADRRERLKRVETRLSLPLVSSTESSRTERAVTVSHCRVSCDEPMKRDDLTRALRCAPQ